MPITHSGSQKSFSGAVARDFRAGQVFFQEGDAPQSFFVITHGTVSIRKRKGSSQVEIARVHQHEVLGELSFFDRERRSATAVAVTDVKALEITFESLDKIYATVPDYMKSIMASVAGRLRKANETIRKLQSNYVPTEEQGTSFADKKDEISAADALKASEEPPSGTSGA